MGYAGDNFTYDIEAIVRRLGQDMHKGRERSPSWKIAYVDRLIAIEHFPEPFPLLVAGRLTQRVYSRSRWNRAAVDQWFDSRTPPGAVAHTDVAAQREGVRTMDERAARLGLSLVEGGRA